MDALAEEGRVSSTLYHVLSLPDRPVINVELPCTPTPRRAPTLPHSLEMCDVTTPYRDTPALCRGPAPRLIAQGTDPVSKCLTFSDLALSPAHAAHSSVHDLHSSSGTHSSMDTASTVTF